MPEKKILKDINGNIIEVSDVNIPFAVNLTETTYSELRNLRDNSELIPGQLYRITDYITTTVQEGTTSAEHPFDVIVLALSENELSEDAWACKSARDVDEDVPLNGFTITSGSLESYAGDYVRKPELDGIYYSYAGGKVDPQYYYAFTNGSEDVFVRSISTTPKDVYVYYPPYPEHDTLIIPPSLVLHNIIGGYQIEAYFKHSNLSAWKIKYCLDNDPERFAWATEGGVKYIPAQLVLTNWTYGGKYSSPVSVDNLNWDWVYSITIDDESHGGSAYLYFSTGTEVDIMILTSENNVIIKDYSDVDGQQQEIINKLQTGEYKLVIKRGKTVDTSETVPFDFIESEYIPIPSSLGIIYHMEDEFGNECPYDFKNILFNGHYTFDSSNKGYYYSSGDITGGYDASLLKTLNIHDNVIKSYSRAGALILNNILCGGESFYNNIFEHDCHDINLSTNTYNNKFEAGMSKLNLGTNVSNAIYL